MTDIRAHSIAKVVMEKENLLKFISLVSTKVNNSFGEEYIEVLPQGENSYGITMQMSNKNNMLKCLHFLNYWSEIKELNTSIDDIDSDEDCERIFLENGVFNCYYAKVDNNYVEGEDELYAYETLRYIVLKNRNTEDTSILFNSSLPLLTRETFIEVLEKSTTIETFKINLQKEYDDEIDFTNENFLIEIDFDCEVDKMEEQTEVSIFVPRGEDTLCVGYDSNWKEFKNPVSISLDASEYHGFEDIINNPLIDHSSLEVKLDLFNDGILEVLTLEGFYAKTLFTHMDEEKISVEHKEQWSSPCTICVNRLEKEINGCKTCSFEIIENN